MDYLEYAYLQIAQDGPAKEVVDELMGFRQSAGPNLAGAYAVAAIPVRYALERRDWPAAAALSEPAIGFPLERFPWAEAMIAYARALGNARTGNVAGAEAEIGRLQSLEDKLKGTDTYWANQSRFSVWRPPASSPMSEATTKGGRFGAGRGRSGRHDGQAPGHPVVGAAGARAVGRSVARTQPTAAALVEYRAMLSTDPNRFRSLLGEARAAKQTGDSATAQDAYRKLVALSKPIGPARPELAEAKSYLTQ